MSGLYNMMFGVNPLSKVYLQMVGLEIDDVGRFRDCFLSENGEVITVYTRNGGGNRECYCDPDYEDGDDKMSDVDMYGEKHFPRCLYLKNERMTQNEFYVSNHDDDFDCTYAYFEFRVPDEFKDFTKNNVGFTRRARNGCEEVRRCGCRTENEVE